MCFTIFLNEKTPLQSIKNASLKSGKIEIFRKGFNPWFWSKIGHFSMFFLGIIGRENVFYDILERKNAFLGYKNSFFKKWKNCDFWKGVNPWVWSNIGHLSIFFQALWGRKMCFTIFQNEQTPSQAIKTACSKSGKIEIFAKELTHGFGLKLAIFPSFFF